MAIKENCLFAIPTLKRYESCIELINFISKGTIVPEAYLIIDNGKGIKQYIKENNISLPKNCIIHVPENNLGVGPSWNRALFCGFEYTIIGSDDITLTDDVIPSLIKKAEEVNNSPSLISPTIPNGHSEWAVFLQTRSLTELVGPYDERFFPGFFEDNDYRKRIKSANGNIITAPTHVIEHISSGTIRDVYTWSMAINKKRYEIKWGGSPGKESIVDESLPVFMRWEHKNPPIVPKVGYVPLSFNVHTYPSVELLKQRCSRKESWDGDKIYFASLLELAAEIAEAVQQIINSKNKKLIFNYVSKITILDESYYNSLKDEEIPEFIWRALSRHFYKTSQWSDCYFSALKSIDYQKNNIKFLSKENYLSANWYPYDVAAIAAYNIKFYDKALEYGRLAAVISNNDARIVNNLQYYIKYLNVK